MNMPNTLGLPSTQYLLGYFEKWKPNDAAFVGKDIMPEVMHPYPSVEWEELAGIAGMTPAHSLNSPAPTLAHRGRVKRTELPFYFGEKQILEESDFLHIRALGTFDRFAGRELVLKGQEQMLSRMVTRLEWARWQAMAGSLAISVNGVIRTVTYATKSISNPSTLWSVVATANPIANLQAWALLFRGLGEGPLECYFNAQIGAYLAQNAIVRDMIEGNALGTMAGTDDIATVLTKLVGGIKFIQYDGGAINADGTTYDPFIGDTKIVLIKRPPMGQTLGGFYSTPSVKNGGPFNPKPGRFSWVKDETGMTDCPKYTYGGGQYGLPVLFFPGNVATVTVAS